MSDVEEEEDEDDENVSAMAAVSAAVGSRSLPLFRDRARAAARDDCHSRNIGSEYLPKCLASSRIV